MKRLALLFLAIFACVAVTLADGYSSLWKEVSVAENQDLPKTELEVLSRIVAKATSSRDYNHLLKAETKTLAVLFAMRDSVGPALDRFRAKAISARTGDPVLAAVYASVMGEAASVASGIVLDDGTSRQALKMESLDWYSESMKHPDALAACKDKKWEPMVETGKDSKLYGNDMLSVIGRRAGAWDEMYEWYSTHGNYRAAISLVSRTKLGYSKESLDSLIGVYGQYPECSTLARLRYETMSSYGHDAKAKRYAWLKQSIERWPKGEDADWMRHELRSISLPQATLRSNTDLLRTTDSLVINVDDIRNIPNARLSVRRLNFDAVTLPENHKEARSKILQGVIPGTGFRYDIRWDGHEPWESFTDTLRFAPLPIGLYLVELEAPGIADDANWDILRVSDLMLSGLGLPGGKREVRVLNAITGKPVEGAEVRRFDNGRVLVDTLVTDASGACISKSKSRGAQYFAMKDADNAMPSVWMYGGYNYDGMPSDVTDITILTDRAIYRPGQQLNASVIMGRTTEGYHTSAMSNRSVHLTMTDATYKEVCDTLITTDQWGTASATFTIPENCRTGSFFLTVENRRQWFSVEEYKRPTFRVEINEPAEAYKANQTIRVSALASSYAGVPVAGASVKYTVRRERAFWCWWGMNDSGVELTNGTATTDDEGRFSMSVPLTVDGYGFYRIIVEAEVTDIQGESHKSSISIPVGLRETMLVTRMPSMIERSQAPELIIQRLNAAGKDVPGVVEYSIDGKQCGTVAAGQPADFRIASLPSGLHSLVASCEGDTLRTSFTLMGIDDTVPCTTTDDWFWCSASGTFPQDGTPVSIQVGSSEEDVTVFYSVFSGSNRIDQGQFQLSNSICTQKYTYSKDYGQGILINYLWVRNGKPHSHSVSLAKPYDDHDLNISWDTFRDRVAPGQQEKWTLRVTNPDGTPAKAHVVMSIYDKSLDALKVHGWNLARSRSRNLPHTFDYWTSANRLYISIVASLPVYGQITKNLSEFSVDLRNYYSYGQTYKTIRVRGRGNANDVFAEGAALYAMPMVTKEVRMEAMADEAPTKATAGDCGGELASDDSFMRSYFSELAAYLPSLETAADGTCNISFTLPESVTTWHVLGLAHDAAFNSAVFSRETVASKQIMVQPNVPRFLREGDNSTVTARVSNTSDKALSPKVSIEIVDPGTNRIIHRETKTANVASGATAAVQFALPATLKSGEYNLRVKAQTATCSDGEQHLLPVLPSSERVTVTKPLVLIDRSTKNIDLASMFSIGTDRNLTIEYTANPAWLMVKALPSVSVPEGDNAISLVTAYFANALGSAIVNHDPAIREAIAGDSELSDLAAFLDPVKLAANQSSLLVRLNDLQQSDGSFTWWKGMGGSPYITSYVLETLARLQMLTSQIESQGSVSPTSAQWKNPGDSSLPYGRCWRRAHEWLRDFVRKEYEELRKEKLSIHYGNSVDYLYVNALAGQTTLDSKDQEILDYLLKHLDSNRASQTMFQKSRLAVILSMNGDSKRAAQYLQSLSEYTVYTEEKGRWFDTDRATLSWLDYKIPTQTAYIEALLMAGRNDAEVTELRRWLLTEKRTQQWNTPINSVNAINAFLMGNASVLDAKAAPVISVNGRKVAMEQGRGNAGYYKVERQGGTFTSATVTKTDSGTSWAAVTAESLKPLAKVEAYGEGLSVKREILAPDGYSVGSRVKVRLTITANQDYDLVELRENRAACMEPVNQLSGYQRVTAHDTQWAAYAYVAPGDNTTCYYFEKMPKGRHIIETEYWLDRPGTYNTGLVRIGCAYAPEFSGIDVQQTITVK